MKLTFIELPLFSSLVTQIADDRFLNQLQNDLLLRIAVETIKQEFRHEEGY